VIERTSATSAQLPKWWIVERTFGWLNQFRHLSKDYEVYSEVSEAMILVP
jgi:putative transposase